MTSRPIARTWGSTTAGAIFTGSERWTLTLGENKVTLSLKKGNIVASILALKSVRSKAGVFWSTVWFAFSDQRVVEMDGIPNDDAYEMCNALQLTRTNLVREQEHEQSVELFKRSIAPILAWAKDTVLRVRQKRCWITRDLVSELNARKPYFPTDRLVDPDFRSVIDTLTPTSKQLFDLWAQELQAVLAARNEAFLQEELLAEKEFFQRVEKQPLTEEQARAVVCMDNRVLVIAAAGSGKTSTIVAKAAYAIKKGLFRLDEVLILAYNRATADEIEERVKRRFDVCGIESSGISVNTFHAFSLDLVGMATGKKPSVAKWAQSDRAILETVERLKAKDAAFAMEWGVFSLIFGQDLQSPGNPVDADLKEDEFLTLNGEIVKSRGEQIIADWLFINGVSYEYERRHEFSQPDRSHGHYSPDFYLPDADAYLEHWAVDANGEPPPKFTNYLKDMEWKRRFHEEHRTTLLETSYGSLLNGSVFEYLEQELATLGVELDPDLSRPFPGRKPLHDGRLGKTFRSFLTHVKNNRLSDADLRDAVDQGRAGNFTYRQTLFLDLFIKIRDEWQSRLTQDDSIDFEDMINLAVDLVEGGGWVDQHRLILLDEFQDASRARARLVKALLNTPDRFLFAVGDDWQSINRFGGADLSVMTDFRNVFGDAELLRLEKTFRCPQSLCDISSDFVQKNPEQIRKKVVSWEPGIKRAVSIRVLKREDRLRDTVKKCIAKIASHVEKAGGKPESIYVLGRYRKDKVQYLPSRQIENRFVRVQFLTMHAAKGLEADHVILPGMMASTANNLLGFPSGVVDDPVLQLAMPKGDSYPYAEERRLFYVALTRARKTVQLLTVSRRISPFIGELQDDKGVDVESEDGKSSQLDLCPACGKAEIVEKTSVHGKFYACSGFPNCRYKPPKGWLPSALRRPH